jgi:hypothetical protein
VFLGAGPCGVSAFAIPIAPKQVSFCVGCCTSWLPTAFGFERATLVVCAGMHRGRFALRCLHGPVPASLLQGEHIVGQRYMQILSNEA